MGIWLYEVMNFSGKTVFLKYSSDNWYLNQITNIIDKVTENWDDSWYFSYDRQNIQVRAYDDGDWGLRIEVTKKGTSNTLGVTWKIKENYTRYNFIFGDDTIWLFSPNYPLSKDGYEHQGWYLRVNKEWKWEPYDIVA